MAKRQAKQKKAERPAPVLLTDLPDELKMLIVESATKEFLAMPKMEKFIQWEKSRLAVGSALRLLHTSFLRLPKMPLVFYTITASLWAAQESIKTSWQPSFDLREMFGDRPRKLEVVSYIREREAFFAVCAMTKSHPKALKRYLTFLKKRKSVVHAHMQTIGVHAPDEEEEGGDATPAA